VGSTESTQGVGEKQAGWCVAHYALRVPLHSLNPAGAADGSLKVWDRRKLPASGAAAAAADACLHVFAFHRDAIMRVEWHASAKVGMPLEWPAARASTAAAAAAVLGLCISALYCTNDSKLAVCAVQDATTCWPCSMGSLMLCRAMLCRALLCCAVPCGAVLCRVVMCCAVL
jgi:hypothetical protein